MQSITAGSHAGYDPSRKLSLIIGKSHAGHLISGLKIPARTRADYLESHAGLQIPGPRREFYIVHPGISD